MDTTTTFDARESARLDLDAYLARIGYGGTRAPSVELLRAIHALHPAAIPFENLNPLLGWPVRLDLESLERKLVREGRGGYCFEHNLLLGHALTALGFEVVGLAARVLWNRPGDAPPPPRTHMLLRIELEGASYLADVGFGGLTPTGPLVLQPGAEQATPHEPFRLKSAGEGFVLEVRLRGSWNALYRFDLQPQLLADYEVCSWYLWNHPASHFRTNLVGSRVEPGRRYALRNTELAVHYPGRESDRRVVTTVTELRDVLEQTIGLTLPASGEVQHALARVIAAAPP
jgi:N-hydroxyarylamine O-acetyltransferase